MDQNLDELDENAWAREYYEKKETYEKAVKEAIASSHITGEDLYSVSDLSGFVNTVTGIVASKYNISNALDSGDYALIHNAAVSTLENMRLKYAQEEAPAKEEEKFLKQIEKEETGKQFAKPRKPISVDKIKSKVNNDRFNVGKFVGNLRDNLLGM